MSRALSEGQVCFLALTRQFVTTCNSSSSISDTLSDIQGYQACMECTDIHVSQALIHINKMIIVLKKKVGYNIHCTKMSYL